MVQIQAISKAITTLGELKERFNVVPTARDDFFPEWHQDLPELSPVELDTLDQIYSRYQRHRERSRLAEGTVNQLLVSPLLILAGLYDEPFFVTTESSLTLEIEARDEILRGRIDTLVIQQQFWVLVVESKDSLSFTLGLPQLMAYMMGNPNLDQAVYGMVTSGDEFLFVKMLTQDVPQYDLSNVFYLPIPRRNQLREVLQILKQIRLVML